MIFRKKNKYYKSIETLPVWNYWMVAETEDYKYLIESDNYNKKFKTNINKLVAIWDGISCEYMNYFGINNTYKELLMLKREIILNEYIWTSRREPIARVYAREAKKELENLELNSLNEKPQDQVFFIEKEMGFKVDPKKISLKDFYSYVNNINKMAKQINKNG